MKLFTMKMVIYSVLFFMTMTGYAHASDSAELEQLREYQYSKVPTQTVSVGNETFTYREVGPKNGQPIVFLHHFLAVIDHWDPAVVDGLAAEYRVIVFDNRGIGGSTGSVPNSIDAMADDAVAFMRALGLQRTHLMGFSMGGFVAQTIAYKYPHLVDKLILTGTGPSNLDNAEGLSALIKQAFAYAIKNNKHRKHFLFFTQSEESQAAAD